MHFKTHAVVICVAWYSLLCHGNAAKGPAQTDLLAHFARVGSAIAPTVGSNETPNPLRSNRSAAQNEAQSSASRRQADTRPVQPQEVNEPGFPQNVGGPGGFAGPGGNIGPAGFPQQQNYPYQFERNYQFRYPQFNQREPQQISQNFFPGGGAFNNQILPNGYPIDPRFYQPQFGNQPIGPGQGDSSKPLSANVNRNGNLKDSVNNNVNTIQSIESGLGGSGGDSKSSAQNRPFDGQDFTTIPVNIPGNQAGTGGLDPANANLRLDTGYAINYERFRQNYYSDPPVTQQQQQQRYYSSFNDVPFNAGGVNGGIGGASGGLPFRSQLPDRFNGLDFNGGSPGRGVGANSELRTGNGASIGLNDPFYGGFIQGPYQSSLNYNSIPGSNVGAGGSGLESGGLPYDGFDRTANFRSPFNGIRYPGDFGGAGGVGGFFPGGGSGGIGAGQAGPGGFQDSEASLRGSSSREALSEAATSQENVGGSEENFQDSPDRIDKLEKIKYVSGNGKQLSPKEKKRAS